MLPKNYKCVNNKDSFYFANNIDKYNLSLDNACHILTDVVRLSKQFNIPLECVIGIIKDLHIELHELFEYSSYKGNNSILIGEKLIYVSKQVQVGNKYVDENVYYDVYLVQNEYLKVYLPTITKFIFETIFAAVTENALFKKEERRFPVELKGVIMPKTRINNIGILGKIYDLDCQDICDLINHPESIDETIQVSLFKHYDRSDYVFLELPEITLYGKSYPQSLTIPYNAFVSKDWSEVENVNVISIIKYDANPKLGADSDNFYNGLQKDAPYFQHPLVTELKKYFK